MILSQVIYQTQELLCSMNLFIGSFISASIHLSPWHVTFSSPSYPKLDTEDTSIASYTVYLGICCFNCILICYSSFVWSYNRIKLSNYIKISDYRLFESVYYLVSCLWSHVIRLSSILRLETFFLWPFGGTKTCLN